MGLFDKESLKRIDWFTLAIVFALVAFGTCALASVMAKPFDGTESGFADYWSKFNVEYLQKHIINFMIGLAAMIVVMLLDYSVLKPFSIWIYGAIIGLLLLLFVFGKVRGGAQGWFIFDSLQRAIQPGELSKIALIITLSKVASNAMDTVGSMKKLKDVGIAAAFTTVPFLLIVLQPDYGTAIVLLVIMIAIMFVARIYWLYVVIAAVAAGAGIPAVYAFILTEKQRARIDVFINPSAASDDAKYHVNQSKMAIGSGQMFGKGLFKQQTLAQLRYVPARHTDFIFSGITEAVGFVGSAILIIAFFAMLLRWLYIAMRARDNFGACIVTGVVAMFAAHIFENIGMTMGIMPVTGIPLPFISYGGSNLLTNMIAVGLVQNVYMHRQIKKKRKFDSPIASGA